MVKLKKQPVDMIVADVETPTGNGLSVMEFLSSDPLVSDLKKVFVTGLNDDSTKQRVREMNADCVHKTSDVMQNLKRYCEDFASQLNQNLVST